MKRIRRSLSATILVKLTLIVLASQLCLLAGAFFFLRAFLIQEYKKSVRDYATVLASQGRVLLETEIDQGRHSLEDFTAYDYRELSADECMRLWGQHLQGSSIANEYRHRLFEAEEPKKDGTKDRYRRYMTAYSEDSELGRSVRRIEDGYLDIPAISFAVLMDRNGFVPFHHTKNSQPLTGDVKKDIAQNRTNRFWDYLGKGIHPDAVRDADYTRDTGTVTITGFAPIHLKGQFWGGVVVGYNVDHLNQKVLSLALVLSGGIAFTILILFLGLSVLIQHSLRPIRSITGVLAGVASGDYSLSLVVDGENEISIISEHVNRMIRHSGRTIDTLKVAASSLAASSEELTTAATTMGKHTLDQVASLRSVSEGLGEVVTSIVASTDYITEEFKDISVAVQEVGALEHLSLTVVQDVAAMRENGEQSVGAARQSVDLARAAEQAMDRIVESSTRIANMLTIIDEISDQINLLSLNASIEAARAGDSGRGFAVVAEQIGKLADRTSSQVKEIHGMSGDISNDVKDGRQVVGQIAQALLEIMKGIQKNADWISAIVSLTDQQKEEHGHMRTLMDHLQGKAAGIMAAAEQQRARSAQMQGSVSSVLGLSDDICAGSQEIAAASEELACRAEELSHLIEGFKTGEHTASTVPTQQPAGIAEPVPA